MGRSGGAVVTVALGGLEGRDLLETRGRRFGWVGSVVGEVRLVKLVLELELRTFAPGEDTNPVMVVHEMFSPAGKCVLSEVGVVGLLVFIVAMWAYLL